jgi:hypothetical protein
MKKSTKNGLIVVGVFVALAGGFYYFTMSKTAYAKTISSLTGIDFRKYLSMDKQFLKARAQAIKNRKDEFFYNGKSYLTKTGTAK